MVQWPAFRYLLVAQIAFCANIHVKNTIICDIAYNVSITKSDATEGNGDHYVSLPMILKKVNHALFFIYKFAVCPYFAILHLGFI